MAMDKNMINGNKKHYKRGYMAQDKQNKKSNCETQPVSQKDFDRMVMTALNTPPRKRTKKDRKKL